MQRFYLLTASLIFLSSLVLAFYFRYPLATVFFHAGIMATALLLLHLFLMAASAFIKNKKTFRLLVHSVCFGYFFSLVVLYLLILSSNYFWKKTIMFSIIRNYFLKIDNFIAALPVEGWLFYSAFLLIVLFTFLLYYFFRPRTDQVYQQYQWLRQKKHRTRIVAGFATAALLLFLVQAPLLKLKRQAQFAEEPVSQFFWGNLWGEGNEMAFDKGRFLLGKKDEACLDSLQLKPRSDNHAVVLILLDALRSDHLPMYGYARNTAPFLDSLYQQKKLLAVQHAFSPSTGTVGGVAGLFYSRDWTEFGYNGLNIMKYLKKVNYTTYAFLTGYHRDWFGLSALYRGSNDYYYESPKDPDVPPDDDMVTIKQFMQTPVARRSFTYIHLLSTHTIGRKNPAFNRFLPNKLGPGVDDKTALQNNYDNGILQADYVIRQVFEKLKKEGILSNCTIYILADHGEMFGEDGEWSHGGSVHPNLINVPLLIYDAQPDWYTNLYAATLKDIGPTIVDRLGYPVPACWEGRSLHQPLQNFQLEINSVAATGKPYAVLQHRDSSFQLDIMNEKKEVQESIFFPSANGKTTHR